MKLLLDTHAFLWFFEGSSKLPIGTRSLIIDPQTRVFVSIVSLWEIAIKVNLGRLDLDRTFPELVRDEMEAEDLELLPVTPAHLERLRYLPLHHKDPFDRMLVAQALADGLTLVSRDAELDTFGVSRLWD